MPGTLRYDRQYRPITINQTAESDGLASVLYQCAINNAMVNKGRSGPRHVLHVGGYPWNKIDASHVAAGEEMFLFEALVPARIGYPNYTVNLWTRLHAAGADATVTLYSDWRPYIGGTLDPVDPATDFTPDVESVSFAVSNLGFQWVHKLLPIVRTGSWDSWLIATVKRAAVGGAEIDFGAFEIWYEELT